MIYTVVVEIHTRHRVPIGNSAAFTFQNYIISEDKVTGNVIVAISGNDRHVITIISLVEDVMVEIEGAVGAAAQFDHGRCIKIIKNEFIANDVHGADDYRRRRKGHVSSMAYDSVSPYRAVYPASFSFNAVIENTFYVIAIYITVLIGATLYSEVRCPTYCILPTTRNIIVANNCAPAGFIE